MEGICGIINKTPADNFTNEIFFQPKYGNINFYQFNRLKLKKILIEIVENNNTKKMGKIKIDKINNITIILRGYLYKNTYNGLNEIEAIYNWYKTTPKKIEHYLKGKFLIFIIDEQELTIINDRFATYHLYYCDMKEEFIFSQRMKRISDFIKFDRILDYDAINEFITFEYCLGEKTFFKNIKILPPATVLKYNFKNYNLYLKRYWYPLPELSREQMFPMDKYLEEHNFLMEQSIKRCTDTEHKNLICLSGGMDSRLIACYAKKLKRDFLFATFGLNNCTEKKYSYRTAAELGGEYSFFEFSRNSQPITEESEEIIEMLEGTSLRMMCLYKFLKNYFKKCQRFITGHMGDPNYGGHLLPVEITYQSKSERIEKLCDFLLKYHSVKPYENVVGLCFHKVYKKTIKAKILANIEELIQPALHLEDELAANFFDYTQRQVRMILHFHNAGNLFYECEYPLIDYDLVDFCFRLPKKLLTNRRLEKYTIVKYFPELAKIPRQETMLNLNANEILEYLGRKYILFQIALKRITEKLTCAKYTYQPAYYATLEDQWLRTSEAEFVKNNLWNIKREFLNKDGINYVVKKHLNGQANNSRLIYNLLTVELWLKKFYDK